MTKARKSHSVKAMWFRKKQTPQLPQEIRDQLAAAGIETSAAQAEPAADSKWLVATSSQLVCVDANGVEHVGYWCEIQNATWEAKTRTLTVTHVDPQQPQFNAVTTNDDPRHFMGIVREGVNHAVVAQRRATCDNDTVVMASVRRGPEGELFSMVVAYGPLTADGEQLATDLENQVREDAGLH